MTVMLVNGIASEGQYLVRGSGLHPWGTLGVPLERWGYEATQGLCWDTLVYPCLGVRPWWHDPASFQDRRAP